MNFDHVELTTARTLLGAAVQHILAVDAPGSKQQAVRVTEVMSAITDTLNQLPSRVPVDDATPMSDLDRPEIKQAAARCLADNIASRERDEEIRNNTKGGGQ